MLPILVNTSRDNAAVVAISTSLDSSTPLLQQRGSAVAEINSSSSSGNSGIPSRSSSRSSARSGKKSSDGREASSSKSRSARSVCSKTGPVPLAVRARRRDPRGERVEWDAMVVKKVRDRPAGISGTGRE